MQMCSDVQNNHSSGDDKFPPQLLKVSPTKSKFRHGVVTSYITCPHNDGLTAIHFYFLCQRDRVLAVDP